MASHYCIPSMIMIISYDAEKNVCCINLMNSSSSDKLYTLNGSLYAANSICEITHISSTLFLMKCSKLSSNGVLYFRDSLRIVFEETQR